jgi:Mn2+/Fe2+ NRAMP family transporter
MAQTTTQDQQRSSLMGRLRGFIQVLGPGLITGASDDDPSGIGTYSQAGAQLGFGIGWTMLLTYPLMVAIQEISARIGRTTGHGIAGNLCRHYPSWLLLSSWCCYSSQIRSISEPISALWRMRRSS